MSWGKLETVINEAGEATGQVYQRTCTCLHTWDKEEDGDNEKGEDKEEDDDMKEEEKEKK